jgi:8-oxo-dGTP diphosphatase
MANGRIAATASRRGIHVMPDPTKKLINVVCAILVDDAGRVFVARRPEGKALAGGWEFPGGKIETNESHEDALKREIREELEIQITVGEALPSSTYDYDFGRVVLNPYLTKIKSGKINLTEHPEGNWFEHKDLPNLSWVPADVPIMQILLTVEGQERLGVNKI